MFTALQSIGIVGHAGGGGGFGWLFLLFPLFWILVFVLIFALVGRRWRRENWGGRGPQAYWSQPSRSAEASLAERFAQGDIDEKEYRARLEVARANANPGPMPRP